ncbi:MAG: nucleotidyl transferase AbiEii/AbiGii toxin family protein [Sporichthyaceae bacterium]
MRITVPARLDRARYPALLGGTFVLRGCPLETVLAEKLVPMIDRADTNTRDRDFADVATLIGRHPIGSVALGAALGATARHRGRHSAADR